MEYLMFIDTGGGWRFSDIVDDPKDAEARARDSYLLSDAACRGGKVPYRKFAFVPVALAVAAPQLRDSVREFVHWDDCADLAEAKDSNADCVARARALLSTLPKEGE